MVRGGGGGLSPFDTLGSEAAGRPRLPVLRAHTTLNGISHFYHPRLLQSSSGLSLIPLAFHALRSAAASLSQTRGQGDVPHLALTTTPEVLLNGDMQGEILRLCAGSVQAPKVMCGSLAWEVPANKTDVV
jgi:hypothetical protein